MIRTSLSPLPPSLQLPLRSARGAPWEGGTSLLRFVELPARQTSDGLPHPGYERHENRLYKSMSPFNNETILTKIGTPYCHSERSEESVHRFFSRCAPSE